MSVEAGQGQIYLNENLCAVNFKSWCLRSKHPPLDPYIFRLLYRLREFFVVCPGNKSPEQFFNTMRHFYIVYSCRKFAVLVFKQSNTIAVINGASIRADQCAHRSFPFTL